VIIRDSGPGRSGASYLKILSDLPYISKWLAEFCLVTGEPYAERLDQILRDIYWKL
jgi:hypothetical protein